MALRFDILEDTRAEFDDTPLLDFLQWLREHDMIEDYGPHYNMEDGSASIVDFGILKNSIEEALDCIEGISPPDIRNWLQKQIDAGRYLAWVSW